MINILKKYKNLFFVCVIILLVLVVAIVSQNSKKMLNSRASTPANPLDSIKVEDVIVVRDKEGNDLTCKMEGTKYVCETTGDLVQIDLNKRFLK